MSRLGSVSRKLRGWLVVAACAGLALLPAAQKAAAAQLTIGILGDYGSAYAKGAYASNENAVATLIKSWNPDFIITTGDNNYPNGEASNIDTNIGQFFHEYIAPYHGVFGEGAASNRFFPCIGNHDWPYQVSDLAPYLAYFTLPGNERYYQHRRGPIELFAVVSDQQEPDGATATSRQALWLSNALAASSAPWRVVYFHECPYSSGSLHGYQTGQTDNMLWPFTEWGASAVFVGHNHVYERVFTNALNFTTIGLGGDRIDTFYSVPTAGSLMRYNTTYGAGKLVVTETNLAFQFINIFDQIIDSYTLTNPPPRLSLRLVAGGATIELHGQAGRRYATEVSTDLKAWNPISTNTVGSGPVAISPPEAGQGPCRFYRAVNLH